VYTLGKLNFSFGLLQKSFKEGNSGDSLKGEALTFKMSDTIPVNRISELRYVKYL